MINFNIIPVHSSKYPPAGAGRYRTYRSIACRTPPALLFAKEYTPFSEQAAHPVLCGAAGNFCYGMDISNRKKTFVERELTHQAQVLAPVFKYARHSDP